MEAAHDRRARLTGKCCVSKGLFSSVHKNVIIHAALLSAIHYEDEGLRRMLWKPGRASASVTPPRGALLTSPPRARTYLAWPSSHLMRNIRWGSRGGWRVEGETKHKPRTKNGHFLSKDRHSPLLGPPLVSQPEAVLLRFWNSHRALFPDLGQSVSD